MNDQKWTSRLESSMGIGSLRGNDRHFLADRQVLLMFLVMTYVCSAHVG